MTNSQCAMAADRAGPSHWSLGFGLWSLFSSGFHRVSRRSRVVLKTGVWIVCLQPLAFLVYWTATGNLTANPISFITNHLGQWTFRLLLASLAMTPLRILFGLSWPVTLRRLLGLFAFAYACLHFSVWIVVDHFFNW